MPKKIMLTIIAICVTIACIGCRNGNLEVDADKGIEKEKFNSGEIKNVSSLESGEKEDDSSLKEDVYKYNEKGKIIIAMYHKFADVETDEYSRSFENFEKDLEYMYELGYRTISLTDYLENNIKVPIGCTPIILTFDDGTKGQFNLIKDSGDKLIANPKSAVGIMEKFYKAHPDFGLNGTFYINGGSFFAGEGTNKERLEYLINKGFEIGNHTNTHVYLNKASSDTIQKEVGTVANLVRNLTGYEINSLALPFGISSKEYKNYIATGTYDGMKYENKIVLLVGAEPAPNPNSEKLNLLSLPRVRARGGNKEVVCDLYYWLDVMEKNPNMKYFRLNNDSGDMKSK